MMCSCVSGLTTLYAQAAQVYDVTSIAWHPDGRQLAVGYRDGDIQIWDSKAKRMILSLQEHPQYVTALAWSPDGNKLASGSYDRSARVWDSSNGKLLNTISGFGDTVTAVTWSPDSSKLITGGTEGFSLIIWDPLTGQYLNPQKAGGVVEIVWSPDNSKLAVANATGSISVWDGTTLTQLASYEVAQGPGSDVYAVAWNPDGTRLASGSRNRLVRIWDAATGKVLADLKGNDNPTTGWETSNVHSVVFSPDGTKLTSVSADGTIRQWNVITGQMLGSTQVQAPSPVFAVAWSSYTGRVALGGRRAVQTSTLPVQIIVPFPSLDELQAITKRCAKTEVQQALIARLDLARLPEFISAVNKLPSDQMPPACVADLTAVAEALQKQP
jgi:WD40 repeat protein